ncbi:MAG: hypothetical protein RJA70_1397 [Pseudomonadota bacterium]|jgi:pimeloyl-ACP methyl ester carboxylesterase
MPLLNVGTENDRVDLYFEDFGAGKPIVLIHGWPLSSRAWEPQIAPLVGAGFRVITYDRRGFGGSSQTWTGYDYDTLVSDLDALMRHLDLREATLVGFSMGGGEVARYLGRFGGERVSKAVFAAAVTPCRFQYPDNPNGALDDAAIALLEASVKKDRLDFLEGFTRKFFSAAGELKVSESLRQHTHDIAAFASAKATLDCIAAFGRTDFRPDLRMIKVPSLVIHGDSDAVVPFEGSGKLTAAALPGASLVVIKGGPHGINASHANEFNSALLSFLTPAT